MSFYAFVALIPAGSKRIPKGQRISSSDQALMLVAGAPKVERARRATSGLGAHSYSGASKEAVMSNVFSR